VTHLGLGLLVVGIAGTTASSRATVVALIDQKAETPVGLVVHRGVELTDGPGTEEAVATLELIGADAGNAAKGRTFNPRLVRYRQTGGTSAEVDTHRGWLTDTQVVLLDGDAERATYRISRHPRISLVWLGSLLTVLGLLVGFAGGGTYDRGSDRATTSRSERWLQRSRPGPKG
jgi:cytochrome c biogenesis factor